MLRARHPRGRYRLVDLRSSARVRHGAHHGGALRARRPGTGDIGFLVLLQPHLVAARWSVLHRPRDEGDRLARAHGARHREPLSLVVHRPGHRLLRLRNDSRPAHPVHGSQGLAARAAGHGGGRPARLPPSGPAGDWPVPRHVHRRADRRTRLHQLLDRWLYPACNLSGSGPGAVRFRPLVRERASLVRPHGRAQPRGPGPDLPSATQRRNRRFRAYLRNRSRAERRRAHGQASRTGPHEPRRAPHGHHHGRNRCALGHPEPSRHGRLDSGRRRTRRDDGLRHHQQEKLRTGRGLGVAHLHRRRARSG